jgi:hypothetical protein
VSCAMATDAMIKVPIAQLQMVSLVGSPRY